MRRINSGSFIIPVSYQIDGAHDRLAWFKPF
jgi:hypothetical protein